jgi:hypothetical protein
VPIGTISVDYGRHGFDFYKLVGVAKHSDSHECARYIVLAERLSNDRPCVGEVALLGGCHEDASVQDVFKLGSCRFQGGMEVLHSFAGLRGVVSDSSRAAIEVQRAGPGEEDETRFGGSGCGVGILRNVGKVGRANKGHCWGHALNIFEDLARDQPSGASASAQSRLAEMRSSLGAVSSNLYASYSMGYETLTTHAEPTRAIRSCAK